MMRKVILFNVINTVYLNDTSFNRNGKPSSIEDLSADNLSNQTKKNLD